MILFNRSFLSKTKIHLWKTRCVLMLHLLLTHEKIMSLVLCIYMVCLDLLQQSLTILRSARMACSYFLLHRNHLQYRDWSCLGHELFSV